MATQSAGMVIYVKDLDRVSTFYADITGLGRGESDDDFVALESESFQLVVLRMPQWLADETEVADPPVRREETPIKPVFVVSSIAAARALVDDGGGAMNGPDREWEFQGWRVCDGHDPEGNVFQLRQPR